MKAYPPNKYNNLKLPKIDPKPWQKQLQKLLKKAHNGTLAKEHVEPDSNTEDAAAARGNSWVDANCGDNGNGEGKGNSNGRDQGKGEGKGNGDRNGNRNNKGKGNGSSKGDGNNNSTS